MYPFLRFRCHEEVRRIKDPLFFFTDKDKKEKTELCSHSTALNTTPILNYRYGP